MTAAEIVANVKNLPPVSPAGLQLMNLLDQPDRDNDTIVQILKRDSALTARVLRDCNWADRSAQGRIASLDQAVLWLGYKRILNIVLTFSLGGTLAVQLPAYGFEAKALARHSFTTALAAELLAEDGIVPGVDPSTAFTAGLLHDIGKLALNQTLTASLLSDLRHLISEGHLSRIEAERQIIGADHAEVGALLLAKWKLPPVIVTAVANHHQHLVEPVAGLSAVTCLANIIAHLAGSAPGWEAYALKIDPALVEALQLTPEKLEILIIAVREANDQAEKLTAAP